MVEKNQNNEVETGERGTQPYEISPGSWIVLHHITGDQRPESCSTRYKDDVSVVMMFASLLRVAR